MQSKATTVADYLSELPPERRAALSAVREVILKNLDSNYEEGMQYGMIGYYVPHRVFPAGYHCDPRQPLPFAGLASQKNHMAVYLMCVYGHSGEAAHFQKQWARTGKKLDMDKSCIRFKRVDDLALDVIGETIRRVPAPKYIEFYEKATAGRRPGSSAAGARKASKASTKSAASAKNGAKKRAGTSRAKRAVKTPAKRSAARKKK